MNLDTGLFFEKDGWTADPGLAMRFPDRESVSAMAAQKQVKHAASGLLAGEPLAVRWFFWITKPV